VVSRVDRDGVERVRVLPPTSAAAGADFGVREIEETCRRVQRRIGSRLPA
jgi:hypothetical protein